MKRKRRGCAKNSALEKTLEESEQGLSCEGEEEPLAPKVTPSPKKMKSTPTVHMDQASIGTRIKQKARRVAMNAAIDANYKPKEKVRRIIQSKSTKKK